MRRERGHSQPRGGLAGVRPHPSDSAAPNLNGSRNGLAPLPFAMRWAGLCCPFALHAPRLRLSLFLLVPIPCRPHPHACSLFSHLPPLPSELMQDILRTERYNWTWLYTEKMNAWIQSLQGTCYDPCTPPCYILNPSKARPAMSRTRARREGDTARSMVRTFGSQRAGKWAAPRAATRQFCKLL